MNISERAIFWKTLCTLDGRDLISDSLKLREVIKYPKTQTLCRYRNVSSHTIEALQTNKLYFSSADYYDDPFDTTSRLTPPITSRYSYAISPVLIWAAPSAPYPTCNSSYIDKLRMAY